MLDIVRSITLHAFSPIIYDPFHYNFFCSTRKNSFAHIGTDPLLDHVLVFVMKALCDDMAYFKANFEIRAFADRFFVFSTFLAASENGFNAV